MAKVLGIGGIFFKTSNADELRDWYKRVLGFDLTEWGGSIFPLDGRSYQVWTPMQADTAYFEPSSQPFMVNFVVDDLDGVLVRARSLGVEPVGRDDNDPYGRFAWLMDPAGTKIELWEPRDPPPQG
jgi:catechol 2,3-dioxygenase-like lactoylglutathione lyase family enzyme